MLQDNFHTSSKIQPEKRGSSSTFKDFLNSFSDFYYKVKAGETPSVIKKFCDPYGFAILCEDYKISVSDENMLCEDIFYENNHGDREGFVGAFSFSQLINLLYRGYWFDYNLAMNIYSIQHDALNIFRQIMNGRGYIMNRYRPQLKTVIKLMNYASESKLTLDEKNIIPIPYVNRVCDGMSWPCIVSVNNDGFQLRQNERVGAYGEGICITDSLGYIVDVLKVNDLWLTEMPLTNRLSFADVFIDLPVASYLKCWSLRSAYEAAKVLNADSTNGVLIRPCHEDFFSNRWFEWNKHSLVYCCKIRDKLTTYNTKRAVPEFYTLEGDSGLVNVREERKFEKMWLDDFDINEFQQILSL